MSFRACLLASLCFAAACATRPARFADAPPIEVVADDAPIRLPRPFDPVPEWRISEAYLRRPLVNALDPSRVPYALDVNAMDDVPRSSWFSPSIQEIATDATDPPTPPFHPIATSSVVREGAIRVIDARGRFFEMWRDPKDRPEMATAAAVITSRLSRALGFRAAGVWALDLAYGDFMMNEPSDRSAVRGLFESGPAPLDNRHRVAIVRWPIGIDLGPTHAFDPRVGDRNDRVPHLDRRTLRALAVVFEWLGVSRLSAGVLRDAYVGAPGAGHVVHYLVDLGGALGADDVVRPERPRDDDADLAGRNIFVTLGTLGLYGPANPATQDRWLAIGEYPDRLSSKPFQTSPPFEPIDRLLPSDAYWIGKRIAALKADVVNAALDAARIHGPSVRARLSQIVEARRRQMVARAFMGVTPYEVERVTASALVLRDEAATRGLDPTTKAHVDVFDDGGAKVAGPIEVTPTGPFFSVPWPSGAAGYAVVKVQAIRSGVPAPRPMETHLVQRESGWTVVGVRH